MKNTRKEPQNADAAKPERETAGQNEKREETPAREPGAGKPQSWRNYLEQTEAAQKRAQREETKSRAAGRRGGKRRSAPAGGALADRARAAAAGAKDRLEEVKDRLAGPGRAAQAGAAAAGGWKKARDTAAGYGRRAGAALGRAAAAVRRHPVSPLLYVTLLALFIGVTAFHGTYARAYVMEVNGQEVAVLSSPEEKDAIVSNVESRAADVLGEPYDYDAEISLTPVYTVPGEFSDAAQVEDALFEDVGAWMTAYSLRVDGAELGMAATREQLQALLDEAAQPYLTEDTVSYEFVENVEIVPVEVPSNTAFDVQPIRDTLAQMRVEQATYKVKKGDTFNAIAYSLDMWPNELSVLNPDVMVNKLWVDQELVIQESVPFLSVQNHTDEIYEETIPSPVEYIETAKLYVGETQVKEQGEDGLARVNAHVTYVNGVEVEREIISSETLEEPTTTYSYTGTTPRPVTASNGYYIWPVRGRITSGFGGRNLWGSYSFHLGIDIACRTGTAIKAADGGTVIKAGWEGTYGKLVAIRHDNGQVTYYAHNSSILVSVGQKVYQGQIIARAGMTGRASGPHCHFEVRINGTSVNPRNYLP